MSRVVVAETGDLALVEPAEGDKEWLREHDDGAFDVDPDDRPPLYKPTSNRLVVVGKSDGELLGSVSWHTTGYGRTFPCAAWNIGMALLPAARGRGAGVRVLRMVVEYLFTTTEVDRLEASTDIENVPAQRALVKGGFRAEGVLRGAQFRGGARRDMMIFGLLRSDLAAPRSESTRTIVIERDGVALAEPAIGEREKFFADAQGDFEVDKDDRPRIVGPARSSLLSVLDASTGALLGGVSWHAVDYGGTVGCSAWNIGIGLLPDARGRGIGTLAQRLLAEHLFASTPLDRVEASTDVDNIAEQKALERAGFRREGTLRGAQLRGGVRRDLAHYGLLRTDQ